MTLNLSYDFYQTDWYVGELYQKFFNYLKDKGHNVTYTHINELSQKYNNYDTRSLTVFNIYNLIVTNDKNKTFIHSLNDAAPAMMDENSGIKNFDVSAFSCCSNLTNFEYERYTKIYNVYPTFYILEFLSDLDVIQKYSNHNNRTNKCYFNGLCYGHRSVYKEMLSGNPNFNIKDKSISSDYKNKKDYFEELNKYNFGLSLNGAANICYRDLEYFGMGILNLREPLSVLTHEPLIKDVNYVNFMDDNAVRLLYSGDKKSFNEYVDEKLHNIIKSNEYLEIINNSKKWYENNCTIDSQLNILYSFLEKSQII